MIFSAITKFLAKATRYPGPSFPHQAATGSDDLDASLQKLDGELSGSSKVRMQVLAEWKDHLLQKVSYYTEHGLPENEAVDEAITSAGEYGQISSFHNRRLFTSFVRTSIMAFLGCAIGSFLFLETPGYYASHALGYVFLYGDLLGKVAMAALFGLTFGWLATYVYPRKHLPSSEGGGPTDDSQRRFQVRFPDSVRSMTIVWFIMMLLGGLGIIFVSILETWFEPFPVYAPEWKNMAIGLFCLAMSLYALRFRVTIQVDESGVHVQRLLWARRSFPWKRLRGVGASTRSDSTFLETGNGIKCVQFDDGHGRVAKFFIYPSMINADRLVVACEEHLGAMLAEQEQAPQRLYS